jgi:hypothetical protein
MADEIITTNDEGETPTVDSQDKQKQEKTFNQKEVDSLIQTRVKREKDSFGSAKQNWDQEKADYEEKIQKFEKTLGTLLDSQKEGLDSDIKELLGELDILKQVEYLAKYNAKKEKIKDTPKIPASNLNQENNKKEKKLNNFLG